MSNNDDDHYLVLDRFYKGHVIKILAFKDHGEWRAIIRCDTCVRHIPIVQVDPDLTFIDLEVQMHGSQLVEPEQDGWHDGLGFTEANEEPDDY